MTGPAERYADFRHRQAAASTELSCFARAYPFGLDDFQVRACRALEDGAGVLVAAPTGSGKTVVGEFAVHLALTEGAKCFYTTPIKALSNQKYTDLVRRHGAPSVGLLTGDNTINGEAPVVVMTTEVLRNMIYARSRTLEGLAYVVMDEVHFLADRFRGAVWEEVIIHLPAAVRLVSLSATVSNAEEFGDWLVTVRGNTAVIVEEHRPVPLWQHVLAGDRLLDLFVDDAHEKVNPELVRLAREATHWRGGGAGAGAVRGVRADRADRADRWGGREGARGRRARPPSRAEVIERLDREGLLPAITFIFSRVGCAAAVEACLRAGLHLLTAPERLEVRALVEERCAELPNEDLGVLGYYEWLDGLERGVAAHHAGMLPTFKEVVEELFARGLVKAVFATETLALGINMPARSVVLERLVKWNGDAHADVTPGEYTQLTGRAGRRGIDVEGHAVVIYQPGMDPAAVAGLASTRTYPLSSSFAPSYNMAVHLTGMLGRRAARELLETSFAQFQADRAVVGIARQVRRNEEGLAGYREAMACHLGDFEGYAALRKSLKDREAELSRHGAARRRAEAASSLEALRPGDVIRVPTGRRAGLAVVLDPGLSSDPEGARPTVLTLGRQVKRLAAVDFPVPVESLGTVRIPKSFSAKSPQSRRDLASSLRNTGLTDAPTTPTGRGAHRAAAAEDRDLGRLRAAIRAHPCHGCEQREEHGRWAERYWRLARDTDALERRVSARTHTIARTFDRVCAVLDSLGYLDADTVTPAGRRLARIYGELDLLTAECLQAGFFEPLTPAELAACASALVFEARVAEDAVAPRVPPGRAAQVLTEMTRTWARLEEVEKDHGVAFQREPDLGFAWPAYRWASGHRLDSVLSDSGLAAGDFVRWTKQLLDVLGQLGDAAPEGSRVRATAAAAVKALRRGVVAYTSVN